MADTNNIHVHIDHNKHEIRNFSVEKLGAHPTGGDLYEGRMWQLTTGEKDIYIYSDTTIKKIVTADDLNKFGALIGTYDASTGAIPDGVTAGQIGSGVDDEGLSATAPANIQKGDFWIISVSGTIAGIAGETTLNIGDILMATADSAILAADFLGIKSNVDTLAQVLAAGNTTNDGQTIDALNGGGQINLRDSSDNVVAITNDSGGYAKANIYFDDAEATMGFDYIGVTPKAGFQAFASDNIIQVKAGDKIILKSGLNTSTHSILNASVSPVLIGTSSKIQSDIGVTGSVAIGGGSAGVLRHLKTNDTAYVDKLGFFSSSTTNVESIFTFAGIADRAVTVPDKSGTLAMLSDITPLSYGIYAGSGTVPTSVVATLTDDFTFFTGGGSNLFWIDGGSEQIAINTSSPTVGTKFEVRDGLVMFVKGGGPTAGLLQDVGSYTENTKTVLPGAAFFGTQSVGVLQDVVAGDALTSIRGSRNMAVWNQTTAGQSLTASRGMVGSANRIILVDQGTVTQGIGILNEFQTVTANGTITEAIGSWSGLSTSNLGTITGFKAYYTPDLSAVTGAPAVGARYGLYLSDSGYNYINGRLGIGDDAPDAKLHVQGEGTDAGTTSFLVEDSAGVDFFQIRDDGSWSLGEGAVPNTNTTVIIGLNASATHASSIVIGNGASDNAGSTREQIIIGVGATQSAAGAVYGVAIGTNASVASSSVAIGKDATNTANGGIAIGVGSTTGAGVAIGNGADGTGNNAVALGGSSVSTGFRATAVGFQANAGAGYSVAIGNGATTAGANYAIAIGTSVVTTAANFLIGYSVTDTGASSGVGIGHTAIVGAAHTIAIGTEAEATGIESIAIGGGCVASAAGAIIIGRSDNPTSTDLTNSVGNSFGIGWEETTPSFLLAKTADSYMAGTGKLGIFVKVPANDLSVSPIQYETGTASQSGNTITGSGTTFTAAMVGSQFIFADGTNAGTITTYTSGTSIDVDTSATVGSQAYKIHYTGLQLDSTGKVGINTTSPTEALDVKGNHRVEGQAYSAAASTLTPTGTTETIDWNDSNAATVDLASATGDVTLTLSNPKAGASYVVKVIQDATTPRDLVWPAAVKWPGGTAPVISTGASAIDLIILFYDGTNYLASFNQTFS